MNTQGQSAKNMPIDLDEVQKRIEERLRDYIQKMDLKFDQKIVSETSFDAIGLDSLARVSLLAELEDEFAIALEPTAAYDFVTVRALSQFVRSELTGKTMDVRRVLEIK